MQSIIAYPVSRRIEPAHQQRSGVQCICFRLFISGQFGVRSAGEQVHESYVVVQSAKAAELIRQQLFHAPRFLPEKFVACQLPQLPHQPGPEPAGPPAVSVVGAGDPFSGVAFVGNDPGLSRRRRGFPELPGDPVQRFLITIRQASAPPREWFPVIGRPRLYIPRRAFCGR